MSSQMISDLRCPCYPNFVYRTNATFRKHFESQRHREYALREENRDLRVTLARRERERAQMINTVSSTPRRSEDDGVYSSNETFQNHMGNRADRIHRWEEENRDLRVKLARLDRQIAQLINIVDRVSSSSQRRSEEVD